MIVVKRFDVQFLMTRNFLLLDLMKFVKKGKYFKNDGTALCAVRRYDCVAVHIDRTTGQEFPRGIAV